MKFGLSFLLTCVLVLSGCERAPRAVASNTSDAKVAGVLSGDSQPPGFRGNWNNENQVVAKVEPTVNKPAPERARLEEPRVPEATLTNDRKIIRNGDFTIEAKNPTEAQHQIQVIAESFGGFVVTSEFQQSSASVSVVNVIVRVPAAQFQAATDKIRGVGTVIREKISGKDVTEEYVDLEAQLRAKRALEAQFLEIMKQARKVEDALSVQENLSEVRTEIERIEGRRRYLENQAALSTVSVTLQTPAPLIAASQTGFWASVKNSFGEGVNEAVNIVLGLIHFVLVMLPVVVLILLPGGLVLRYCWRRFGWGRVFKKADVRAQPEN